VSQVQREDFLRWYRHQAVDAASLRASGAANAARLSGADASGNGEIAVEQNVDELNLLFDRLRELDPNAGAHAFEAGSREAPTRAGAAYSLITIHMRQKSGPADEPLGNRKLSEIPALAAIFEGRRGAKLKRVDNKATAGTGYIQDALNEIAAKDEQGKPAGYKSAFRVEYGNNRGYFGGATERAVRVFQLSVPILDDGVIGKTTIEHLDAALIRARGAVVVNPPDPPVPGAVLTAARFQNKPIFARILAGETTLARGSREKSAVEMLQATLYSLGYDVGAAWIDSDFGRATEAALKTFQIDAGLPNSSGILDRDTLIELDTRAAAQVASLRALTKDLGSKHRVFRLVADIAANRTCRIYVLDKATNNPVAMYLTSPGRAGHETAGDRFTVTRTLPRATWYPPQSAWARGLAPVGPGLKNPMGILKLDLGRYAEYIHGIPKSEEAALGRPASHGCLRMSPTNILHLFENYAESGTDVRINRDRAESLRLEAAAGAAGLVIKPVLEGREYLAGYVSGELGRTERYANGQTLIA
jgi:peptidoglycan hydrolase-like protein with peptidoglycan-binding domain